MFWFRIAARLGKTVTEAQQGMTTLEFFEWMEFLRWETEEHRDKSEHYMAGLIAETRRSWVSKPSLIKSDDFLMTFKTRTAETEKPAPLLAKKPDDEIDAMSDEEYNRFVAQQTQLSKGAWFAWVDTGQQQPKPPVKI